MALALMCREYMPENGTTLHALVVDHGLRPSSRDEATRVQQTLKRRLSMTS
jgi:tRNA(Ile)-lysidine synthase TilS/MesJ